MATHRPRKRSAWLLSAPLTLLVALPAGALEARPDARPAVVQGEGWLAQKPPNEAGAIPAEVQGWFEGAKAAASKGDAAEALRLQKLVVAWLEAHPGAPVIFRARALINLGVFLGNGGQKQEALAPTLEAVRLLRPLEGSKEEARRFLGIALSNLGNRYNELGRRQEALAQDEEAVKVYRELAKTNPAYLGDLGMALNNLGVRYTDLGRRQEALAQDEEAVKIRRELAKTNPAYLGDLATSLNNLGVSYTDLGRRQEALAPTEEAVKIHRELAKTNPAFLGDLAGSLNNLGVRYSELGRRQEALAPTEEAVKVYRELAKTNPAFLGDLAMALNNLGIWYSNLGRRQEALAPTEEAVKIHRELAKTNPAFLGDLAGSLNNLGLFKKDLGEPEQARAAFDESLTIIRPLAAANPAFQDDLQRFLNNLEELNRKEGIRTGQQRVVAATDLSYLPRNDPTTPVKRAVVRLWPTFSGKKSGIGLLGTGFVVRREGERAWIATALHVVRDPDDYGVATKVEAELFTGPIPEGLLPPRLEVLLPVVQPTAAGGDDLIVLEVRGLPADIQALPLTTATPAGTLTVVGHPNGKPAWAVQLFPLLEASERQMVLKGRLDSGASGSPVLNSESQVLGLVYESGSDRSGILEFVTAYRSAAIQPMMR
jgi:tetratricopeptide (TPR) repeat protein